MHVDHSEPRSGEHRIGEDLAVGRDHAKIRVESRQSVQKQMILQALGLQNRYTRGRGASLHRSDRCLLTASAPAIGLRDDGDDLMTRCEKCVE